MSTSTLLTCEEVKRIGQEWKDTVSLCPLQAITLPDVALVESNAIHQLQLSLQFDSEWTWLYDAEDTEDTSRSEREGHREQLLILAQGMCRTPHDFVANSWSGRTHSQKLLKTRATTRDVQPGCVLAIHRGLGSRRTFYYVVGKTRGSAWIVHRIVDTESDAVRSASSSGWLSRSKLRDIKTFRESEWDPMPPEEDTNLWTCISLDPDADETKHELPPMRYAEVWSMHKFVGEAMESWWMALALCGAHHDDNPWPRMEFTDVFGTAECRSQQDKNWQFILSATEAMQEENKWTWSDPAKLQALSGAAAYTEVDKETRQTYRMALRKHMANVAHENIRRLYSWWHMHGEGTLDVVNAMCIDMAKAYLPSPRRDARLHTAFMRIQAHQEEMRRMMMPHAMRHRLPCTPTEEQSEQLKQALSDATKALSLLVDTWFPKGLPERVTPVLGR
jgi:hypothetical protein